MVKVTINKIQLEMEFETICDLIKSGAFDSDTDIILETHTLMWKWNKSTEDKIFTVIGFKK